MTQNATRSGDHIVATVVPIVVAAVAALLYPRLRPGLQADTALYFGLLALVDGRGRPPRRQLGQATSPEAINGSSPVEGFRVHAGLQAWAGAHPAVVQAWCNRTAAIPQIVRRVPFRGRTSVMSSQPRFRGPLQSAPEVKTARLSEFVLAS